MPSTANVKAPRWPLQPTGVDPAFARLLRRGASIIPLWRGQGKAARVYGRYAQALTKQGVDAPLWSSYKGIDGYQFGNPPTNTLEDYWEGDSKPTFTDLTIFALVDPTIFQQPGGIYNELVTRGSLFRNGTHFTFGCRGQNSPATQRRVFFATRSSGGTLTGREHQVDGIVDYTQPAVVAGVWSGSTLPTLYCNATQLTTGTNFGTGAALQSSTDNLRIGAGTSPTSTAQGFQSWCGMVVILPYAASAAEVKEITRSLLGLVRQPSGLPLIAAAQSAAAGGPTNVVLDPVDMAWTGQDLTVNAKTQIALDAVSMSWTGQALVVNQGNTVSLDPADMTWTGQALQVNAKTMVSLAAAAMPWSGQSLTINSKQMIATAPASLAWVGQDLTINAKTMVALAPVDMAWTGQALNVNTTNVVTLSPLAMPWTGQTLKLDDRVTLFPVSMAWNGQAMNIIATVPERNVQKRTDVVLMPYKRAPIPTDPESGEHYVDRELRKLENSLATIMLGAAEVTDTEPNDKKRGMVRYAVDPWNPGSGEGLYVYKGPTLGWVLIA